MKYPSWKQRKTQDCGVERTQMVGSVPQREQKALMSLFPQREMTTSELLPVNLLTTTLYLLSFPLQPVCFWPCVLHVTDHRVLGSLPGSSQATKILIISIAPFFFPLHNSICLPPSDIQGLLLTSLPSPFIGFLARTSSCG